MDKNKITGLIVMVVAVLILWKILPFLLSITFSLLHLAGVLFLVLVAYYVFKNIQKRNS
jgi:membrane associated rhomboid family serine protease